MKFKILNLLSTFLLLVSSLSGGLTVMAEPNQTKPNQTKPNQTKPNQTKPNQTKPYTTWDYDTNNPSLGEYDQLLQNAGPSDGIVDWYPARNALGTNPSGQDLVKQLIELSIATNNVNSNARSVLFNDTTGTNNQSGYEKTYNKYKLAYGFIAQLLDFNNAKTGLGAKLKQGAVAGEDPVDPRTNESVIEGAVTKTPGIGEGHTIADILGRAFFGEADEAYAQIYLNGYDNTIQNEANIIREGTSSITIVAQSKLTGKKATAIFKLNNKTVPIAPTGTKLNNYKDNSVYAIDKQNGNGDIAGLNMTTASQNTIDNIKFSKESTFWVDNKNGGGTIVVPRGTSAKQIAELISQKQLSSNNTLQESAPMKAIQAVDGTDADGNKFLSDISYSYNHFYSKNRYVGDHSTDWGHANDLPGPDANPASNPRSQFNFANPIPYGINGPGVQDKNVMREYNNIFNGENGIDTKGIDNNSDSKAILRKDSTSNTSNQFVISDEHGTANSWFGGTEDDVENGSGHMLDTNNFDWSIKNSRSIPEVKRSEGTPYDGGSGIPYSAAKIGESDSKVAGAKVDSTADNSNVGKVKHLFEPKNYFKEAYDANHFVNNSPEIQDKNVDALSQKLANNGSFSNTSSEGQVKKSFTYETPASAWIYKSYNNPYSTVMSSAGAQTINGEKLEGDSSKGTTNSTIQPQTKFNYSDPNDPDPTGTSKHIDVGKGISRLVASDSDTDTYFYLGTYKYTGSDVSAPENYKFQIERDDDNPIGIDFNAGQGGTIFKYGAVGLDGENPNNIESGSNLTITTKDPSSGHNKEQNIKTSLNLGSSYYMNTDTTSSITTGDIINFGNSSNINAKTFKKFKVIDDDQFFVQVWDKNTHIKDKDGNLVSDPKPLIYNKNVGTTFTKDTLGQVDSPNFEAKYYLTGAVQVEKSTGNVKNVILGDHIAQTAQSKRAYFNSNLYNNPSGSFAKDDSSTKNSSRFFVSQDFSIGPVSRDMINNAGSDNNSDVTIEGEKYPAQNTDDASAEKILKLAVMYNNPENNEKNNKINDNTSEAVKSRFTDSGKDVNGEGNDGTGYKLVSIADAANKQGVSEDALANEVAKVTGKSAQEVKNTKWVQATLPRLRKNAGSARINVVVYDPDKAAVPAPSKPETKPSFSTTDVYQGNDPFKVNLRPYTTVYDDGAVLKVADVPQSFKNLLNNTLVTGNSDLINNPSRLQQVLVSAFLNSWQQNDGSFDQTDSGAGVNSPLYLYGGFGISNSDSKNSYSQWPNGYATNTGDYLEATSNFSEDFYRGGKDLQLVRGGKVKGIPTSSLKADVSKVDLSKAGTYPVVYTYTNPSNSKDTAKITVPITVKGAAAPVFAFQGGSDVTIHVGDSFDRNAYKVVGNWDIFNKYNGDYNKLANGEGIAKDSQGNLEVTITGDVDTSTPGIYQVTYEATNLAGAKTKLVRNINVLPNKDSNKPEDKDWTVIAMKGVGYINYVPGYGINVWNAPHGIFTGQRLLHVTAWKISQKAVNSKGEVYYCVGKNQWIDGQYVSFSPVSSMQALKGIVTINYVPGYGVNLWKSASTTGGYYDRKLAHGSKWKVMGQENGFYNVGKNQWIQAKYAKFQAQ